MEQYIYWTDNIQRKTPSCLEFYSVINTVLRQQKKIFAKYVLWNVKNKNKIIFTKISL